MPTKIETLYYRLSALSCERKALGESLSADPVIVRIFSKRKVKPTDELVTPLCWHAKYELSKAPDTAKRVAAMLKNIDDTRGVVASLWREAKDFPQIDIAVFAATQRFLKVLQAYWEFTQPDMPTGLENGYENSGAKLPDAFTKAMCDLLSLPPRGGGRNDEAIRDAYHRQEAKAKPGTKKKDLYKSTAAALGIGMRTVEAVIQGDKRTPTLTPDGDALDLGLSRKRQR